MDSSRAERKPRDAHGAEQIKERPHDTGRDMRVENVGQCRGRSVLGKPPGHEVLQQAHPLALFVRLPQRGPPARLAATGTRRRRTGSKWIVRQRKRAPGGDERITVIG